MLRQLHAMLADMPLFKTSQGGSGLRNRRQACLVIQVITRTIPTTRGSGHTLEVQGGPGRSRCRHEADHRAITASRVMTKGATDRMNPHHQMTLLDEVVGQGRMAEATDATGASVLMTPTTPTTMIPTATEAETSRPEGMESLSKDLPRLKRLSLLK